MFVEQIGALITAGLLVLSALTTQQSQLIGPQMNELTSEQKSSVLGRTEPVTWGTYTGWRANDVVEFENKVGSKTDIVATFVHWGNESEFPAELGDFAKANNKTLVIYWEAMDYNFDGPNDPRFAYERILGGSWDDYIKSFAKSAGDYGGEVILIPFEEMNGAWYPWSGFTNGNSPQEHIEAFRYLRQFFTEHSNVKFAWDVNVLSEPQTPENATRNYYPGGEYVDYVGVNGFNFADPWVTPQEIFSRTLDELESYGKPIYIFSTASAAGQLKASWIRELGELLAERSAVVGFVWFNENKERDWRVWSSEEALGAFSELVAKYSKE